MSTPTSPGKLARALFVVENTPDAEFLSAIYTPLLTIPELKSKFPEATIGRGKDGNILLSFLFDRGKARVVTSVDDAVSPSVVTWTCTPKELCRILLNSDQDGARGIIIAGILGGNIRCTHHNPVTNLSPLIEAYRKTIQEEIGSIGGGGKSKEEVISGLERIKGKVENLSIISKVDVHVNKLILELYVCVAEAVPTSSPVATALLHRIDSEVLSLLAELKHQHTLYDGVYRGENFNVLLPMERIKQEAVRRSAGGGDRSAFLPRSLAEMRQMSLAQVCHDGNYGFVDPRERRPIHMGDGHKGEDPAGMIDAYDY